MALKLKPIAFISMLVSCWTLQADLIFKDGSIKNENSGPLKFDTDNDGSPEITFTQDGKLGLGTSSPAHTFDLQGAFGMLAQNVSSDTTLSGNTLILGDTSGGSFTLTLPIAASVPGRMYEIKKISDSNTLTVKAQDVIENKAAVALTTSSSGFAYVNLFSDGGKWNVRSQSMENTYSGSGNLVGWWPLNESSGTTANDFSGQGLDGTLNGGVTFSNNIQSGKLGTALGFDGVDDYISVADASVIGDGVQSGLTVSLWFKSDVSLTTNAGTYRALEKGDCYFIIQGGAGTGSGGMNFIVKRSDTIYFTDLGTALNAGQWYHIVGTFDGSDIKLYLDGSLMDTTSVGGPIDDDDLPLRIGSDDGGKYFDGVIDDVLIYNFPLSLTDIQAIYNRGQ